jgi:sulfur-carrier protein
MATVKLFGNLRSLAGSHSLVIEAVTMKELFDILRRDHQTLAAAIFGKDGKLSPHYKVMIDGHDMNILKGIETVISSEDVVAIFPPVAGGSFYG